MEPDLLVVAPPPSGDDVKEPESDVVGKRKEMMQLVMEGRTLTKKELDFCDDACLDRYLKVRGNNVRKAAKMLKATLIWREKTEIAYMIADEFPADIAAGSAYIAGNDDVGRPVLIIKKKPDHILSPTQNRYLRYLIFTMEVALAAMDPGVDQWVLIFDARAGYSKSSTATPSGILTTLKMLSDHYPERLAKAFIVDASSIFYHVWKGMCTFVDHPTSDKLHFAYTREYRGSLKAQQSLQASPLSTPSENAPRRPSNACADDFERPTTPRSATTDQNDVSLPTAYDSSPMKSDEQILENLSDGPELNHSVRTRSFSFSSIMTMSYTAPELRDGKSSSFRKEEPEEVVDEPKVVVTSSTRSKPIRRPWDGLVSIFHSQKKDEYKKQCISRKETAAVDEKKKETLKKEQETRLMDSFLPYLKFFQEPYSEASYRALMKPPLGGLTMIISAEQNRMDSF